jgi:hypothetical protein
MKKAWLLQLLDQPDCAGAMPGLEIGKGFHAAGCVGCCRPQQFPELMRGAGREAAMAPRVRRAISRKACSQTGS